MVSKVNFSRLFFPRRRRSADFFDFGFAILDFGLTAKNAAGAR
jgi:hypothetical protein